MAGSCKKTEGCVIAQAGVQRKRGCEAPGILGIEAEAADALRKGAVSGASGIDGGTVRIGIQRRASREHTGSRYIEAGILRIGEDCFEAAGKRAAKNRFVDEIDAEADGVGTGGAGNVVAELIFLLVAVDGKGGDGGGELVVAESFEAGSGEETECEGKIEGFADGRVARFCVMEATGLEGEGAEPRRRELKLVVEKDVVVVGSRGGAGRGQSPLLEEIVAGVIAVERAAHEPLRARGLLPIETAGKERVEERHGHGCWNGANGSDVRKIAGGGELGKRAEFGERLGTIGDAGVFVDVFVGSEEPEFASLHWAAEGGDGVLAREGLLGIGFGIIERIPRVQILSAIVVGQAAMPVVSAAACGENDAAAVGARSIRAKLRGTHDKFLHRFGREILEEAADVIVVVVAAVNGEVDVEPRAAAER